MEISLEYLSDTLRDQLKIAQLFNARHQNIYKYSKKYLYTYDVDEAIWVETEQETIISHMKSWLNAVYDKIMFNITTKSSDEMKKVTKLEKLIETKTSIANLTSVFLLYKCEIADKDFIDNLDRNDMYLLPIRNRQIIDLKTGIVRPREHTDLFTYYCDVAPTDEKSEVFQNFINSIMCNNDSSVKYLQTILGYCMSGDMSAQSVFILWGHGSNGKSVLLNLLNKLLDKAYKPVSKNVILNMAYGKSAGPELIDIKNSRLVTFSETGRDEELNAEIIKTISGGDAITARGLYKDPIVFKLQCKLLICTNNKPKFDGNDFAMTRRLKFIPFEASFVDKPNPNNKNQFKINKDLEKTIIENHLDEFFTFCVRGAKKWFKTKVFELPDKILKEQVKYFDGQGNLQKYVDENIIEKQDGKILRSVLYNNYKQYCDDNGTPQLGKQTFFDKIVQFVGEPKNIMINGMRQMAYAGFSINDDKPDKPVVEFVEEEEEEDDKEPEEMGMVMHIAKKNKK
jgi:putative DNA primase/helicase